MFEKVVKRISILSTACLTLRNFNFQPTMLSGSQHGSFPKKLVRCDNPYLSRGIPMNPYLLAVPFRFITLSSNHRANEKLVEDWKLISENTLVC